MKKLKLVSLLLVVVFSFSLLSSFHGQKGLPEFEIPESFDESREYEITFWAKNDNNSEQRIIYEQAVEEFEKLYPNVHITIRRYTDYNQIYNDVITNISTGTTPNICISYPDHIATYLTGDNIVVPLDKISEDEKYGFGGSEIKFDSPEKSEVISKFLEECKIDGTLYALPFVRSTEAVYINKTLVEKLGFTIPEVLTWDWMWEVADAATEKDENGVYKVNGQNVMVPFIYKSTDNMMIQAAYQMGSGYSTEDGENLLFNDSTKEFLLEISKHVKNGAFSTFKISSYPGNYLNAGQAIFGIDSTAGATWMGTGACNQDLDPESLVDFELVVKVIPQMDTENPLMISQGPSICIFNKQDPQEVLASWLFAEYLLTNDVQIAYSQTEGYCPVTTKALESEEYQDYLSRSGEDNTTHYFAKIDATKILLDNMDNTFITPVFNGSTSLRNAAGQLIENVVKGVRRGKTVDEEFIEAQYADVEALYRLGERDENSIGKKEFGELDNTAKLLITGILTAWIFIALYAIVKYNKGKGSRRRSGKKEI